MLRNNVTLTSNLCLPDDKPFEMVERKGIGHPDTLADGIAESISIEYSKYCLKKFGVILHHALDKIMLIGGLGKFGYGMGEMLKPWQIILNGKMSNRFCNKQIPFEEIEIETTKRYLKKTVPRLDVDKWVKFSQYTSTSSKNPKWLSPDSIEDVPDAKNPYANDTSVCSGYWPLSTTERLALLLESYFYLKSGKPKFNFIGQDIKVMCIRKYRDIYVTMCVPFFSRETQNYKIYLLRKNQLISDLYNVAMNFLKTKYNVKLFLNTQDDMVGKNTKSVGHYFVISGSALDSGEEGVVGRGNRSRGIISTIRPLNMEAVCGKNPVYFVGKVYTYLADKLSQKIAENYDCACNVYISSRNSDPLHIPYAIFIETARKVTKRDVSKIIEKEFEKRIWTKEIIEKKVFLPTPGGGNGYRSTLANSL